LKILNINSLIYTIIFTSLLGCNSSPVNSNSELAESDVTKNERVDSSFLIFGGNQSLTTHTKLSRGTLTLGDIEIKNWPLSNLDCSPCKITLDRRFHPDGPTSWLLVENNNQTKTWIVSSFQQQFVVDNWQVKHRDDQVLITDTRSSMSLDSKNYCSIKWSKKEALAQPGNHIAPDVAKFKSQFIIQCEY
jgi:hypothetical protein